MFESCPGNLYERQNDLVPDESDRGRDVTPDDPDNPRSIANSFLSVRRTSCSKDIEIKIILEKGESDNNENDESDEALFPISFHYTIVGPGRACARDN